MAKAEEKTIAVKFTGDIAELKQRLAEASGALGKFSAQASKSLGGLADGFSQIGTKLDDFSKRVGRVGKELSLMLTAPIAGLGTAAVASAAKFEQFEVAFTTMLGSVERGSQLFKQLVDFSAQTPFQLEEVARAAQILVPVLQQAGLSMEQMPQVLTLLGNAAAATGQSISDLALIFMQSASTGRVLTQDLRQLAQRGVISYKDLADTIGVTTQELTKMLEQGKVPFTALIATLERLSAEGGRLAGATTKQAQTISGLFSTLKDRVVIALADIGKEISKAFNLPVVIPRISALLEGLTQWFASLSDETKRHIVLFTVAIAGIGPALFVVSKVIGFAAGIFKAFSTVLNIARGAFLVLGNSALLAQAKLLLIGVVIGALVGLVMEFAGPVIGFIIKRFGDLINFISKIITFLGQVAAKLGFEGIAEKLHNASEAVASFSEKIKNIGEAVSGVRLVSAGWEFLKEKIQTARQEINKAFGITEQGAERGTEAIESMTQSTVKLSDAFKSLNSIAQETGKTVERAVDVMKELPMRKVLIPIVPTVGGKLALPERRPQAVAAEREMTFLGSFKVALRAIDEQLIKSSELYRALVFGISKTVASVSDFAGAIGDVIKRLATFGQAIGRLAINFLRVAARFAGKVFSGMIEATQGVLSGFKELREGSARNVEAFFNLVEAVRRLDFAAIFGVALQRVPDVVIQLIERLGRIVDGFFAAVAPAFASLANVIMSVVVVLVEVFAPILAQAIKALAVVFQALQPALEAVVRLLGGLLVPLLPYVAEALSILAKVVSGLVLALVPVLQGLAPVLEVLGQFLVMLAEIIGRLVEALTPFIVGVLSVFIQALGVVVELLIPLAGLLDALVDIVAALAPLLDLLVFYWRILASILKPLVEALKFITGLLTDFAQAIAKIIGFVGNVVRGRGGGGGGGGLVGFLRGLLGLQHGGIVTRPVLARVGEAGPEAVIPLERLPSLLGGRLEVVGEVRIAGEDLLVIFRRAELLNRMKSS